MYGPTLAHDTVAIGTLTQSPERHSTTLLFSSSKCWQMTSHIARCLLWEVSVSWLQNKQDSPGCLEAFKSFALALNLVGHHSARYPALKQPEMRRSVYPSGTDGEPNVYLSQQISREGLVIAEEAVELGRGPHAFLACPTQTALATAPATKHPHC